MTVDGKPATRGMPLESELRYYYNFYFAHHSITFGAFLSELSRELSGVFPGLDLTLGWARECDEAGRISVARNYMQKLRSYVQQGSYFRTSFWDTLWKLTEVSIKTFGINLREIGTTSSELISLTYRYFLKESSDRVQVLRKVEKRPDSANAQKAFLVVDGILNGIPIPPNEFCRNSRIHYSRGSGYEMYRKMAEGTIIPPWKIDWSTTEHLACRANIFPAGVPDNVPETGKSDPTAPATIEPTGPIRTISARPEKLAARIPETIEVRRNRGTGYREAWSMPIFLGAAPA
ncbi:MAG: hypothetical protein WD767_02690 [Alphaproteobacteria bacterium]